jgi:peptide chain release factor 1
VVEIHHGEGGDDSKAFVHELFAAYIKYTKILNLKSEILLSEQGHAILLVSGSGSQKAFCNESGQHVIQRKSKKQHHTSVVVVAILPLPPDGSQKKIPEDELVITTQVGHGKGGQHQNKTESAVRIVHKITGLKVFINGRDQHANKREAIRIITARVNEYLKSNADSKYEAIRKEHLNKTGRGSKARTYNMIDSRVVDHRTGKKTKHIKDVLEKGNFGLVL